MFKTVCWWRNTSSRRWGEEGVGVGQVAGVSVAFSLAVVRVWRRGAAGCMGVKRFARGWHLQNISVHAARTEAPHTTSVSSTTLPFNKAAWLLKALKVDYFHYDLSSRHFHELLLNSNFNDQQFCRFNCHLFNKLQASLHYWIVPCYANKLRKKEEDCEEMRERERWRAF